MTDDDAPAFEGDHEWPDDDPDEADEADPSLRDRLGAWLATDRAQRHLRLAAALAVVGLVGVALVAVAWAGWGVLSGGLFIAGVVLGAAAPPVAILMGREAVPNLVGSGLAIAAQVAFGKAGLVRRDDGQYEWGVLREDAEGYYVALSRGDRVPIDADEGELFAFGFGQLAVSEQHGHNLDRFRETHTPGSSEQATEHRAGIPVAPPRKEGENTILVSLAKIQRVVRGSASSTLVRRGRDKALDDAGGTGQLSTLWTMAFAAGLLIVGFGMTAGVLML